MNKLIVNSKSSYRIILIITGLMLSGWCGAQTIDEKLVGKWRIVGIRGVDSEPWSDKLIELMLGKGSYKQFFSNHRWTILENNETTHGNWAISSDGKEIITTGDNGNIRSFDIKEIHNDTLILLGGRKTIATLIRVTSKEEQIPAASTNNVIPVAATINQICKKWVFQNASFISTPNEIDKQALPTVVRMLRDSYYHFNPNGTVESKIVSLKKSTWHFENNNTRIVILDETGDGAAWDIIALSATQLTLHKPSSKIQFTMKVE